MSSPSFTLDDTGARSLDLLIAVSDRVLGQRAAACRELRNLRKERSAGAYERAGSAFNALVAETRAKIAAAADRVAQQVHQPSPDLRQRFPELFPEKPAAGKAVAKVVWN